MTLFLSLLLSGAQAQETVDIGVLKDSDVQVVQKLLYPKTGRAEFGLHLGYMPFDFATKTPNAQVSVQLHSSETLSFGAVVGAGYGFASRTYRELEGPQYGIAYYAYRYLGSALVGAEWAPIYGKNSLSHRQVVHHDLYGALRAGATLESSLIPTGGVSRLALGPTVSPAVGARIWMSDGTALRLEVRDDIQLQRRALTSTWAVKQNVNVTLGYTVLTGKSE
ncbi:MAG: outer membrane beta-barrel domain-containing protein [Proteobacteria bacterium]|nr:outer membrane beta-barrel domain-containing protein [Pseudomonadota bacterium]